MNKKLRQTAFIKCGIILVIMILKAIVFLIKPASFSFLAISPEPIPLGMTKIYASVSWRLAGKVACFHQVRETKRIKRLKKNIFKIWRAIREF